MTDENLPSKPGWYPVTIRNSCSGKKERTVVKVYDIGVGVHPTLRFYATGLSKDAPVLDSHFSEWGTNIDDALARLAELEAERRDVDTILDAALADHVEPTLEDRTSPAPGWEWCCTKEHSCRYLVNVDGPVKGNGSRRIADTVEETWAYHDADRVPEFAARLAALETENTALHEAVSRALRRANIDPPGTVQGLARELLELASEHKTLSAEIRTLAAERTATLVEEPKLTALDWDERLRQVPNVEWTWGETDGFWYISACLSPESICSVAEIESWRQHVGDEKSRERAYETRKNYPEFARLVDERNEPQAEPMTSEQIEALEREVDEAVAVSRAKWRAPRPWSTPQAEPPVESMTSEQIEALPLSRAEGNPNLALEEAARSYVEHLKAEGIDEDRAYARVLDRLLANGYSLTNAHGKTAEWFAAHLVYDTIYAKEHARIELWIDNEGSPGMFVVDGQSEEQLAFHRDGVRRAVFHDMTWPAAKKLYDMMLGHDTTDERWRKKYEAAFVKIDHLAMSLNATLGFDSSADLLRKQTQLIDGIIDATRSEKQPEWDQKFGLDYHQMREALLEARRHVSEIVRHEHNGPEELLKQIDEALKLQERSHGG
jgi:hypothetical protein